MKFQILLLLIFVSGVAYAQTLIAYYPLNGDAKDASGNHFDGVTTGGVIPTHDRNGYASQAFRFDGQTGKIDVPDAPALQPSNLTLSAWFYFSKIPNRYKNIVTKNLCNATHESFGLYLNPHTGKLEGTASDGAGSIGVVGPTPTLNTWHFATMTFDDDNDSSKLYLDGALVDAISTRLHIAYDTTSFAMGYELENCADAYFFSGKIDDVRLYNGVLSNKQVSNLFDSTAPLHKAGSGTALHLNGKTNYLIVPQTVLEHAGSFTIEYWIRTTENRSSSIYYQRPTMIGNETYYGSSKDFGITTDNGRIGMWSGLNSAGDNVVLTNTKINDNKWHHIAVVNNGSDIILYVDGILQDGSLQSGSRLKLSQFSFFIGASNSNYSSGPGFYHQGEYDEVRFWDKALTKEQIRSRMCHKIIPSDVLYKHLVAYYNFDEDNTTTAFDIANYNNALLINNPQRLESDAPIGDASVNDYDNGVKTDSITAASGETFTVTSSAGKTGGLQLYVVNENPEFLNGVNTLCNQNKYFGVFQANDKNAAYSAVYNYTANPCVDSVNESSLRMYQKQKSSPDSNYWYELPDIPNINSKTITINNISAYNAKFILGLDTALLFAIEDGNTAAPNKHLFSALVFPDPVTTQLNIINNLSKKFANSTNSNSINLSKATLQVINITGNVVITKEVDAGKQNILQLNVLQLAAGFYFVKLISDDGTTLFIEEFEKQ